MGLNAQAKNGEVVLILGADRSGKTWLLMTIDKCVFAPREGLHQRCGDRVRSCVIDSRVHVGRNIGTSAPQGGREDRFQGEESDGYGHEHEGGFVFYLSPLDGLQWMKTYGVS